MKEVQLTKREYVGEGYMHQFRDAQGKQVFVPCTKEEYERMGLPGGSQFNPTLEGHTWECSYQGTLVVDTPSGRLGENDYTVLDGKAFVSLRKENGDVLEKDFEPTEIVDDKLWL